MINFERPQPSDETPLTGAMQRVDALEGEIAEAVAHRPPVSALRVDRALSKYHKRIRSEVVDVYDVLAAFAVTCPATQHAIKKLLMPGMRGAKDRLTDLNEAQQSLVRAIEIERERTA